MRNEDASTINTVESHEIAGTGQFSESLAAATNQPEKSLDTKAFSTMSNGSGSIMKKQKSPKAPRLLDSKLDTLQNLLEESKVAITTLTIELNTKEAEIGRLHQHIAIQQENHQVQGIEQLQILEQKQAHITMLEQDERSLRLEIQNLKDIVQQTQAQVINLQHHIAQKEAQENHLQNQINTLEQEQQQQVEKISQFQTQLEEEQLQVQLLLTEHIETLEKLDVEWQQTLVAERLQLTVTKAELQKAQATILDEQQAVIVKKATAQLQIRNLQKERQEFAEQQLLLRQALSTNFQRREVETRTEVLQLKRQLATIKQLNRQHENTMRQLQVGLQSKDALIADLTTTQSQVSELLATYQTKIQQSHLIENGLQHNIVELQESNHSLLLQTQVLELEKTQQQQQINALITEAELVQQNLQQQLAELATHAQVLQQQIHESETEKAAHQSQIHELVLQEQASGQTVAELTHHLTEQSKNFDTEYRALHAQHSAYVESAKQTIERKDAEFVQITNLYKELLEGTKNQSARRSLTPLNFLGQQLTNLREKLSSIKEKKISIDSVPLSEKSSKIFSDLKIALR
jgi:chromosome segregation ATPase